MELSYKGVSEEDAENALASLGDESENAARVAEKYMRGKEHTRETAGKCYRYLISKGFDYETAKKVFASAGPERRALKKSAKEMAKVFGELDEDLRDDIVTVCLLITAIDGKVSLKEKAWIKKMLG